MSTEIILKNKEVPEGALPIVNRIKKSGEEVLFVIVGDLNLDGNYDSTALLFTSKRVYTFDGKDREIMCFAYSDMTDVTSKR
ncbi:MAG: hypothetical protein IKS28_05205, partial [Clostridia bacterium]|nr:hypothetical protein [Clostridia bacterium]